MPGPTFVVGSVTYIADLNTLSNAILTQSLQGSNFTAVRGFWYILTANALQATLPASPGAGDLVRVSFKTGSVVTATLLNNGNNIEGVAGNKTISGDCFVVYTDATTGWKVLATAAPDTKVARRNGIVNYAFEIAQRQAAAIATALTTAVAYPSIDRWWAYQPTTANGVFKQSTTAPTGFKYSAQLGRTNANAGTNKLECGQAFESIESIPYQGQTTTLKFWAKAGANFSAASSVLVSIIDTGTGTDQSSANQAAATWTGQVATTQNNTISTTWAEYSQTLTIPTGATQIGVRFNYVPAGTAGADDNVYITGVRFVAGGAASDVEVRPYAVELVLCQRWLPGFISNQANGYLIAQGNTQAATVGKAVVIFPVPTRVPITAIVVSAGTAITMTAAAGNFASTAVTISGIISHYGAVVNTTIAGATAGQGCFGYFTAATDYLFFTGAEL